MTEELHTEAVIQGLRIETADKDPSYSEDGIPEILAGSRVVIRLFGTGITEDILVTFTDEPAKRGTICDKIKSNEFPVIILSYYLLYFSVFTQTNNIVRFTGIIDIGKKCKEQYRDY